MQLKVFLDLILHQPLDRSPEKPIFANLVFAPNLEIFLAVPITPGEVDRFDGAKPSFSAQEKANAAQGCP
jgi:hypothetical protein